jgi:GTPase SAR1 family protein
MQTPSNSLPALWKAGSGTPPPTITPNDAVIAVIGMTGVGKTSFIRSLVGVDMQIGHDLEPCECLERLDSLIKTQVQKTLKLQHA